MRIAVQCFRQATLAYCFRRLISDVGRPHKRVTPFLRGIGVRQVRLTSGFVLFSYLLSHFINHALGNISLDAMEYGL
jgi:hypothetical protein